MSAGVGVTKPIFSIPFFSEFISIVKTHATIEYIMEYWNISWQK